jgi:hypothetical protein
MRVIEYATRKPSIMLRRGVGIFYSEPNGGMVLKHEVHWTKISGIWVNTRWGSVWLRFRRFRRD